MSDHNQVAPSANPFITFHFDTLNLRIEIGQDDEPWFCAKDVCDILEIANSRDAVTALDDDERDTVATTDGVGGVRLTARGCRVYSEPAPAKSGAGFDRPNTRWRTSASTPSGAFFVPGRSLYGVQRGETARSAGVHWDRSVNPALAATLFRLTADVAASLNPMEHRND